MEGECKVLLDAAADTDSKPQTAQSVKTSSKLTAALLAFTLCLAVAAATVLVLNSNHAITSILLLFFKQGPGRDEDTFELHHALRQISDVRAAIHLQGTYNPNRTDSVEWHNEVDQTFAQGGLKLKNNEIVIPHSGLYFVYSQASFSIDCSSDEDDDTSSLPMVHLSHTVKHWSRTYGNDEDEKRNYETILKSVRTACQKTAGSNPDEGPWFSAVYVGAVFSLNKEDRLKTETEEKMLQVLEDNPGNTFFGVFAL
ncbi:tumor necrosis factor a (TNF superfamily, member 2) [Symphorus nematophorus]